MKTTLVTYHVAGYKDRLYQSTPGTDKGTVNLLDAEGQVIITGVPLYEDPTKVEKLPAGYCTPGKDEKAIDKTVAKPKKSADPAEGTEGAADSPTGAEG